MLSEGIVIKTDGELATVGVKRQTACDTCRAQCGGHCDKASIVETVVKNTLGAKVGDRVRLYSKTSRVIGYALAVFILPLITASIGFAVPWLLGGRTVVNITVALALFLLTYVAIWRIWGKAESQNSIEMYDIIRDA